jgi:striatin 1/3/4
MQEEFGQLPNGFNQYSLPGIMHWLQMEWVRFEREELAWNAQRVELQSRVATLEGEKRSLQALQFDLTRRVKMLEATLKQER